MQGYRRDGSTQILVADPTLSGCTFAGWFTQRSGGTRVTALDSSTAGVTLYAQYSSNGSTGWTGGTELEGSDGTTAVIAQGTVKCTSYVNVRKGPGTNYTILARAVAGSQVEIYQTKWVGSSQWGRMTNGWICMDYVSLSSDSQSGSGSTDTQISGTVSGSNVNVRSGAGTGYSIVGRKNSGDVITVYERKTSGGLNWGRIGDNQWICLAYVRLENAGGTETPQPGSESNSSVSGDGTSAVQDTGTVSSTTGLNVRSGPGTGYARIKTLSPGTVVSLYEYRTVDGVRWGRIQASQWVCMTYVQLSSQSGAESEQTGTGKVISTTVLNIRSGPGTNYSRVGQLTPGTKIEITEQTKTNGVSWGKTAQGWVCMTYVKMG